MKNKKFGTFEQFASTLSAEQVEAIDATYDRIVNYTKEVNASVSASKGKRTRDAKKLNALRSDAMIKLGLSLSDIYPLSIESLTKLVNGELKFNDRGSLVPV